MKKHVWEGIPIISRNRCTLLWLPIDGKVDWPTPDILLGQSRIGILQIGH